ncbi:protein SIEVE ELEMENT OCCLUSION C isoform X2 [Prosopis cineraria]|uniref:protein SIEVE ELEMENT OCCLUSION C isoform X2 n=1 Tax=Prosopis cineraria TaxID=364024 RepID=UPI00240FF120|nr:protein SIEVE ELEMENT OCCLUSION C isoform X2 [Prosopis cineraria]
MNFLKSQSLCSLSNSNIQDDILMKKLLLTHDPDGRWLDSETMLHAVGNIMFHASTTQGVPSLHFTSLSKDDIYEIELLGCAEPVGSIISKISCMIMSKCSVEGDINSKTMGLFDLLGSYRWDAKVVLVIAAFAAKYGEFCGLMQLYQSNALAVSVTRLKQLPVDLRSLKPRLKALSLLVKTMMEVAKCIIKFESLPNLYTELGSDILHVTKFHIYVAVYWTTRSIFTCFSQVAEFTTKKHEQVYSDSTILAAWELSSLAYRLSSICNILKGQVDLCHQEIGRNLHNRLLSLAAEVQNDNQGFLSLLFPVKDYLPLKDCSTQEKIGVSELKNKIVVLLISKTEQLTLEESLLLVQQTYDHPLSERDSYKIIWVPLPSSDEWTDAEETRFNILSEFLPWYTVRKPRLLSLAVVKYVKEEWNYKEEPQMVVLDSNGNVINSNAIDMVKIWGPQAYPFSASKESELWQDENLTMRLLIDDINLLLAYWVEEGKDLCLYGCDNLGWIRKFNGKIEELKRQGLQLETVYVATSQLSEHVKEIMETLANEFDPSNLLLFTKLQFFWLRLESMRRSKVRLGKTSSDQVLAELSALLDMNEKNEGWVVIGRGSSSDITRLQGRQIIECLEKYEEWGDNVEALGLVGAIRNFLQPPLVEGPCSHSYLVPSSQAQVGGTVVCDVCKRTMKKYVVYV